MQLDLFEHSESMALRNAVLDALQQRDAAAAGAALACLAAPFPDDATLPALQRLVEHLAAPDGKRFASHTLLAQARAELDGPLTADARIAFGAAPAQAWLAPIHGDLARRAALLPFDPAHPADHAAPLWLRAGDWAAAADAAAGVASWRRIPAPLGWMAEARWRLHGIDAAWPLLVELAWIAPARFDALSRRLADPLLDRLRKQFDAAFEGEGDVRDVAWLPAWLLTAKPALAARFAHAQPSREAGPEQATALLLQLLQLERQGRHRELVERRKSLLQLHPFVYAAYMQSR